MFLYTKRLELRRIREDDWESVQKIWEDFGRSDYAQYDKPHGTQSDEVRARIARWANEAHSHEHYFFAVCLEANMIGYAAFNKREDSYELGYCFHSDYFGNGYAKESLLALFAYLRTQGVRKITAGTALLNHPSVRLLRSLGFEQIGEEDVSFYQDAQGNDIVFRGGVFALMIEEMQK